MGVVLVEVRSLQQQIAGEQLESGVQCSWLLLLQGIILQPWSHGVGVYSTVLLCHFVRTVMLSLSLNKYAQPRFSLAHKNVLVNGSLKYYIV